MQLHQLLSSSTSSGASSGQVWALQLIPSMWDMVDDAQGVEKWTEVPTAPTWAETPLLVSHSTETPAQAALCHNETAKAGTAPLDLK